MNASSSARRGEPPTSATPCWEPGTSSTRLVRRAGRVEQPLRVSAPTPPHRKERAFRLALESGIRTAEAQLEWTAWALRRVRSPDWRKPGRPPSTIAP